MKRGGGDRDEVGPDSPATFRHPATASRVPRFGRNNATVSPKKMASVFAIYSLRWSLFWTADLPTLFGLRLLLLM